MNITISPPLQYTLYYTKSLLFVCVFLVYLIVPAHSEAQIVVKESPVNDPLYSQQTYLKTHNIVSSWFQHTSGNNDQKIAIHSLTGFSTNHEDMVGRTLNPYISGIFLPERDVATELAGIIGANTNNAIGIAGVNWHAKLKSYSSLRTRQSSDSNDEQAFIHEGIEYYFDFESLESMMVQSIQDQMDINLFTYNMPSPRIDELDPDEVPLSVLDDLGGFELNDPMDFDPESSFRNLAQGMFTGFLENFISDLINGPQVGEPSPLRTLRNKIAESTSMNNTVNIAAAGDIQESTERLYHLIPAVFDSYVITVGGAELFHDGTFEHWGNSMTAPYVDVAAVASGLVTISSDSVDAYNLNFDSTAGAAAIVTGVVSLIKDLYPELTHDDIEEILKITAIPVGVQNPNPKTGHGLVDSKAALDYLSQNEIVHATAQGSEIEILEDEPYGGTGANTSLPPAGTIVDFSGTYNNLCIYNCAGLLGSRGELNRIVGKIDFGDGYSHVDNAWLRITSSGIDTTVSEKAGQWFHY